MIYLLTINKYRSALIFLCWVLRRHDSIFSPGNIYRALAVYTHAWAQMTWCISRCGENESGCFFSAVTSCDWLGSNPLEGAAITSDPCSQSWQSCFPPVLLGARRPGGGSLGGFGLWLLWLFQLKQLLHKHSGSSLCCRGNRTLNLPGHKHTTQRDGARYHLTLASIWDWPFFFFFLHFLFLTIWEEE